jgi:hypothetical protein
VSRRGPQQLGFMTVSTCCDTLPHLAPGGELARPATATAAAADGVSFVASKAQRRHILPENFLTWTNQALKSAAGTAWFENAAFSG